MIVREQSAATGVRLRHGSWPPDRQPSGEGRRRPTVRRGRLQSCGRTRSENGCRWWTCLLEHVDEYLVLGEYDAERRTGPAVWVRCIVDRTPGRAASSATTGRQSSTCRALRARTSERVRSVRTA